MISHEDKVDVVTPTNILFGGVANFNVMWWCDDDDDDGDGDGGDGDGDGDGDGNRMVMVMVMMAFDDDYDDESGNEEWW